MEFSRSKTRFLNSITYLIFFSNKKSNSKKILTKLFFLKNNYWRMIPNEFDKSKINIYSQFRSQLYWLLDSQNEAKPRSDLHNWERIPRNLQFLYLFHHFLFHYLLSHRLLNLHDRSAVKQKKNAAISRYIEFKYNYDI